MTACRSTAKPKQVEGSFIWYGEGVVFGEVWVDAELARFVTGYRLRASSVQTLPRKRRTALPDGTGGGTLFGLVTDASHVADLEAKKRRCVLSCDEVRLTR